MLVSVDQLRDHMSNIDFDESQRDDAEVVLAGIQADLEKYLNRKLEPVLVRELRKTREDGTVRFSQTPVRQIVSVLDARGFVVNVKGSTDISTIQPVTDQLLEELNIPADRVYDSVGSTFFPTSIISPGDMYVGPPGNYFIITYIAGYIGSTDNFVKGILDVASRVMSRNHDDSVSILEGITQPTSDNSVTALAGMSWTSDELARFDRDRRRVVV